MKLIAGHGAGGERRGRRDAVGATGRYPGPVPDADTNSRTAWLRSSGQAPEERHRRTATVVQFVETREETTVRKIRTLSRVTPVMREVAENAHISAVLHVRWRIGIHHLGFADQVIMRESDFELATVIRWRHSLHSLF